MTPKILGTMGLATMVVLGLPPADAEHALAQERVVALRAAWVIDATGRPPIADGIVIVRGRRIDEVGPRASIKIPQAPRSSICPDRLSCPV
jgi:hypothetical protein